MQQPCCYVFRNKGSERTFYESVSIIFTMLLIQKIQTKASTLHFFYTFFLPFFILYECSTVFLTNEPFKTQNHCVKSVCMRSYSGSIFSRIRTEYRESLRIQSECGKILPRISPNTDAFYAANVSRHVFFVKSY